MRSIWAPAVSLRGLLLASLLFPILVTSCGPPTPADQKLDLTVRQSSVSIGDPHIASDSSNRLGMLFSIYEALVKRDASGAFQPGLAERWEAGENGRTWTFFLRQDVVFHNGEVLKASDVVATMGRVLDPAIGGAFGTQGVYISYLGTADISAPDEQTVRIETEAPMADLLDLLVAMPISPASELHRLPNEYVGSGPYRIAGQEEGRLVMEAHDRYWGGEPDYQTITWVAERGADRRVAAVLNGEADLASGIGIEGWQTVQADGGAEAHQWDSGLAIIFMLNAQDGACTDRRVRQALNYAVDVEEIIAGIVDGAAKPLNGYLTPHHFGYDPETPVYPYDPDEARRLLAEAGYADGLTLTFDIPSTMPDEAPALAELMAEQLQQVGISLEIVVHEDRAAYSEMVREKRINDGAAFDSSPRSTYRVLREKIHSGLEGPWWEGYENLEVDALIEEAERTFSDPERQAIYRRLYRLIRDDAPWIFLYRPTRYWATGPALAGWEPRADGLLIFS
jgi:peptide/nickel transport system substrate-binding protein